jgi:hypothetical protein
MKTNILKVIRFNHLANVIISQTSASFSLDDFCSESPDLGEDLWLDLRSLLDADMI